jgi:hypothetical protein
MKKSNKFSPEVRERAVRMVQEHRGAPQAGSPRHARPSVRFAVRRLAPLALGLPSHNTSRLVPSMLRIPAQLT